MRIVAAVAGVFVCSLAPLGAQEVGQGAPNEYIRTLFLNAFHRGNYFQQTAGPAVGLVKKLGTTGYVQEFSDSTKAGAKLALIKADLSVADPETGSGYVYQVFSDMYAYYTAVTVNTAGYPIMDTLPCPGAPCSYQVFDKRYALFIYPAGKNESPNIAVRDPFYTHWDIYTFGPAVTGEVAVTSSRSGAQATVQTFLQGALFNMTSGASAGRFFTVRQPVFAVYAAAGGQAGTLGLPLSEEQTLANGNKQQRFEGGVIEYAPGGTPAVKTPVTRVVLPAPSAPLRLNLGDTVTLQAAVFVDNGAAPDRSVAFTTSNSRVVALQPSGQGVLLRAAGGGQASITAVSEGKSSEPVVVVVTAPCCGVGEGAPSITTQQLFVDAVQRARINLQLPSSDRVHRAGNGYVQEFQGAGGNAAQRYLVAVSDRTSQASVVSGEVLRTYERLGGPASALGYPISDQTPGGRQNFEGGAIAGSPGRVVTGNLLQKWAVLGYESGPAGSPVGDASSVLTFTGTTANTQLFEKGQLVGPSIVGAQAVKAYLVSGPIFTRYAALGSANGVLGLPLTDEFVSSGRHKQDFEGGTLDYAAGDADMRVTLRERKPAVAAAPSPATPGTRLRLTISGFQDRTTLRVSVSGQPDFIVQAPNGSYTWEVAIPLTAPAATVRIKAADANNPAMTAETTYSIRAASEVKAQLAKLAGDGQTGAPGALLLEPLKIQLRNESGVVLAGVPVRFSSSPGAIVQPQSAVTDSNGLAQAVLRLPPVESVVLVTAEAFRQVATFSALGRAVSLVNFPKLMQSGSGTIGQSPDTIAQKGALLTAVAAILRYYQDRGELPMPRGAADPSLLNEFLKSFCSYGAAGAAVCDGYLSVPGSKEQIVNLWRVGAFVANNLDVRVEMPDVGAIRNLAAQGSPVLLALLLKSGGAAAGGHYVVATGVASDGTILIHDPNPVFGRANLNDYFTGFTVNGATYTGALTGAARLRPVSPSPAGFLVSSASQKIDISSRAGNCGPTFEVPGLTATGANPPQSPGWLRHRFCDGSEPVYQLDLAGEQGVQTIVTDLAEGGGRTELAGGGPVSFKLSRPGSQLVVSPLDLTIGNKAIVNAATYTPDLAPGGLASAFGSGLAREGSTTSVEVNGQPARVLASFAFQVNFQIPPEAAAGAAIVRISSPYGAAEQEINLQTAAPEIFRLQGRGAERGAVVNQDGSINQPGAPARRGSTIVAYGTGLGAVRSSGQLSVAVTPAAAVLHGQEVPVVFAGLTPGFIGLYQVNIVIPASIAPGLELPLTIQQGKVGSSPVLVAVE
ncbi:MAG TPA: hypothetical protein VMZ52_08580 [Bryobacteraceae bacterium]|nr:hypothetical protein [Bryobacteraceae bacterium]